MWCPILDSRSTRFFIVIVVATLLNYINRQTAIKFATIFLFFLLVPDKHSSALYFRWNCLIREAIWTMLRLFTENIIAVSLPQSAMGLAERHFLLAIGAKKVFFINWIFLLTHYWPLPQNFAFFIIDWIKLFQILDIHIFVYTWGLIL